MMSDKKKPAPAEIKKSGSVRIGDTSFAEDSNPRVQPITVSQRVPEPGRPPPKK
jgi:hypothetical protein